jgi:hypothetical protein
MSSRLAIAIVVVVLLLLVIIVLTRSADPGGSPTNDAAPPQEGLASPEPSASPATPSPAAPAAEPKASGGASTNPSAAPSRPLVASALLCQRFTARGAPDWDCEQPRGPVDSRTLVFYTRIKSMQPTTVQHRWYHGNDLHQSVILDVRANQVDGYRTYSRYTVKTPGAWRVELRTMDGALLHEERFDVR